MIHVGAIAAEVLPTKAEVHQKFDDAKYLDVVKDVAKITASREYKTKKTDAYDLLTLKAEAHLRLKENALAASTFEAASKETTDKAAAALVRTTALLIKKATGSRFVPKATTGKHVPGQKAEERPTIDIVDPELRKTALTALWQEERTAAELKIGPGSATDTKSMQAVMEAAPMIAHLRDYDLAAHGNDDDTKQAAAAIATHGKDLLTEMVDKMTIRVDVISSKAYSIEQFKIQVPRGRGYDSQDRWRKHGLEGMQTQELTEMVSNTDKILLATKILSESLSPEKDFFGRIVKESKRIHDKASKR